MQDDLKNKVAFITGAAHGQGRAAALALAKEGVHIVAFDIAKQLKYPGYTLGSINELESLKKQIEDLGVKCIAVRGDVRNNNDIAGAVNDALSQFKKLDILFNNAGICAYGLTHEIEEEEWDAMIDINLKGSWLVAKNIIPVMIRQR